MFKHMLILVLSLGLVQYARSTCNVCRERSGVACISEKEFYICVNGVALNSTKFSCMGDDEVCTHLAVPCQPGAKPSCGDKSNCNKCEADDRGIFTCTGRTTFTMCDEGILSDFRGQCPDNQICDVEKGLNGEFPCVPSCMETKITTCDYDENIEEPETTTVEPITSTTTELSTTTPKVTKPPITSSTTTEKISTTTEELTTTTIFDPTPPPITTTTTEKTTTTTQNPAELVCSQQTAAGRYPYPNDATCKKYIYCFKKGGTMQTTFMKCPGDFYFNPATTLCGSFKPQGCI
ncbi:uncharacterized protein ACRADG_002001 [Cochliomyia hominivorax]